MRAIWHRMEILVVYLSYECVGPLKLLTLYIEDKLYEVKLSIIAICVFVNIVLSKPTTEFSPPMFETTIHIHLWQPSRMFMGNKPPYF